MIGTFYSYTTVHVILYNGGWGELTSHDVLVMSEAGVKLYHHTDC